MKQEFNREEALRYLGISERTLRGWERQGLVEPAGLYTLPQIVVLRAVARLRQARLPARRIQAALTAVRRQLPADTPLTEFRLYAEGRRIRVRVGGQHMEPESGQLLLDFNQGEIERMVSIPARRALEDRQRQLCDQQEAEKWFLRGVELEAGGMRGQEAIKAYEKALALDPQLAAAHVNLGTIYFSGQDWAKAEHHYRRAVATKPDYPLAHFNLANLHDERGEREQALAHYQAALKLDPNYADAHYNVALLYQASGSSLKAVRHWRTYLKLDPGSSWAAVARRELAKLSSAVLVHSAGRD